MLWEEDQRRIVRERRDRMVELFQAARDAQISADILVGRVKSRGGDGTPAYARPMRGESRDAVPRSPQIRDRALAALGAMYPGMVRRHGAES